MKQAHRFSGPGKPYFGLTEVGPNGPRWTGKIELVDQALDAPLHWKKPRRVFVNSMSDLFHEAVPDAFIDRVFAVMALAPQHTFQVLTKRPERMRAYFGFHEDEPKDLRDRIDGAVVGRPVSTSRRNAKGYVVVEFCQDDEKRRVFAHQVVARAFIGAPPTPEHVVNHIDGVKTNNAAVNLEWSTRAENNAHATRLGLLRPLKGEANGRAKLTEADVADIRLNAGGGSQRALAKRYGVARTLIQRIQQGKAWK